MKPRPSGLTKLIAETPTLPELPANPTEKDYATAYASLASIYQTQNAHLIGIIEEFYGALLDVQRRLERSGMPWVSKAILAVLVVLTGVITSAVVRR